MIQNRTAPTMTLSVYQNRGGGGGQIVAFAAPPGKPPMPPAPPLLPPLPSGIQPSRPATSKRPTTTSTTISQITIHSRRTFYL